MKRKALALVASFAFCLVFLTGCQHTESNKLQIVTTIFPQYDFARQIAGEQADVSMLLAPGQEAHSFEPTPQDIKTIQDCDLFIYTGGENDVWIDTLLASMGENAPETIRLVDCVDVVEEQTVEGMEKEPEHEGEPRHEEETEIDEHVWTSPKNAQKIVDAIADRLGSLDAEHAQDYTDAAARYNKQLDDLNAQFHDVVDNADLKLLIFGDRFPLRYFADEYGLSYYAAFPGCAAENEASAKTVAFLIDKVQERDVPVVFSIELSNGKIADAIADATGAQHLTFNTCHNVTASQMEQGVTYVDLMEDNVDVLRQALTTK